ncbi:MAG TPA: sigma-70 family RNA polymerase sigma factor [Burkholderiaceae bacterium]|nr:sigma-70 family RNA polymerase sigma factor [Burkholderiaceae bacterium]
MQRRHDDPAAGDDDAALARRIAAASPGIDGAAEAALCRRLAPRIRLYGLRHLRDAHAAADLVQQALMMTLERLRAGAIRDPEQIVSFVFGTSRQLVVDLRRGLARRDRLLQTYAEDVPAVDPSQTPALDHARLRDCLERLAERDRSVLVLSFYEECPARSVGDELGLTEANVRVIRHRALQRLRDCVEAGVR